MENHFNQYLVDLIDPNEWKMAFDCLADYLTRTLAGRTRRGPFSAAALGCEAVEYLSKRAFDLLCTGRYYWPLNADLGSLLCHIAKSEIKRIETEWRSKKELSDQEVECQLNADRRAQNNAKAMAYRIAEHRAHGNPKLLAFISCMQQNADRRAIARNMKISLVEVESLEAELLRCLR